MEEQFKLNSYYSVYGAKVVHYDNLQTDIGYSVDVKSKYGFDQRQVLQVRSAIKKFEETLEGIVNQRLNQVVGSDLATKGVV